jgi:signal transduction histidine kinase/ActR/RegA family two-component response regulator
VIEKICQVTGATAGAFWLLEGGAAENALVSRWTCGFGREITGPASASAALLGRIPIDSDGPIAQAVRNKRLIVIHDVRADALDNRIGALAESLGIRSMIAVPLRARGRVEGAITLYWQDSEGVQDEAVVQTAEVLANQVAAVLSISSLVEELSRANRLKDEFLSTVSHELRNPLNVILGYSELILRNKEVADSSDVHEAAEVIHRNATFQADLVSDLLDLSRLQIGRLQLKMQPTPLAGLIAGTIDAVRNEATAKGVVLRFESAPLPVIVEMDATRMRQIMSNLLSNALKFTPRGGRITVRLSVDGGSARIEVEDTGQGIHASFLPEIFGLFRQADASTVRRHGGMGIGLALVRHLVELHRGRVTAASEGPGKGACFTILLPIARGAQARALAEEFAGSASSLAGLRILIVDDSADTVRMLAHLLRAEGAIVETATNGPDAIRAAEDRDHDLFLCDISMPGMDGYELISEFRKRPRTSDVPAIALTGFGQKDDIDRALNAGFWDHLTKPVSIEKLVAVSRKVIGQQPLGL